MQDNFNIYNWRLKQAITELEEKQLCQECGSGYMEEGQCNECGYLEEDSGQGLGYTKSHQNDELFDLFYDKAKANYDIFYKLAKKKGYSDFKIDNWYENRNNDEVEEATFTDKHDDNPKLKGGQKDLPDEVQAKIVAKEGHNSLQHIERIEEIIDSLVRNVSTNSTIPTESKIGLLRAFKELKGHIEDLGAEVEMGELNEGEDHEVSMAQASLKAIISSASQLISKLGDDERNIPGWIQDHITNAENYIEQANQGFHELEPAVKDIDVDALDTVAEGVSDDLKTKAKNALAIHLRSAMADKNQEHIDEIKDARDRINNAKSVEELANILGEFGYEDDDIQDILS